MPEENFAWNTRKYIDLVENGTDEGLQQYQKAEIDYLTSKVESPQDKTFVDVGAGYGRILPQLSGTAKRVIAVELDENLSESLSKRVKSYPNCEVVIGDANQLSTLLAESDITKPVLVSVQNCLGPWVGDRYQAIDEMRKIAEPRRGEVIISLFCRESMKEWGLPMYQSISGLLGEYDPDSSDLEKGIYRTKTGYESYWFSKDEREAIKGRLGGQIAGEIVDPKFHIIHVTYT